MENAKINTIVFDWGNTLMQIFEDEKGPMVNWKKVAQTANADTMLAALDKEYQLVVATNAQESSAEQVRAALDRVDLGRYFNQIFTYNELGAKKPEIEFFHAIEDQLGLFPKQLLMIGDDYHNDILPAWQAGWYTLWFNPNNLLADAHLPVHHYESLVLDLIPEILKSKPMPTLQTSLAWYMKEKVSHSLLEHVQTVAAAAYQMAVWLREEQPEVSPLLAHRGGYLHDLAKLIETNEKNHAVLGEELLNNYKQPALAKIAGRHLMGYKEGDNRSPQSWEEKLVHYADKLVEGNALVTLDDRLSALKLRYPNFVGKIQRNEDLIRGLEKEIADALHTTPEALVKDLQTALWNGTK